MHPNCLRDTISLDVILGVAPKLYVMATPSGILFFEYIYIYIYMFGFLTYLRLISLINRMEVG